MKKAKRSFKPSPLGPIPEDWEVSALGGVCVNRGSVSGPFGSSICQKYFISNGVPVIRGNNLLIGMKGRRFIDENFVFVSEEKAKELSRCDAAHQDIILTARGTIGQTGIIPNDSKYDKYILSANQLRFRIDQNIADPVFIYYRLSTPQMTDYMLSQNQGSALPNMNLGNARALPVLLPPNNEQRRIAEILSSLDDKIELNRKMNKTLESIAQALFKRWFVEFEFPDKNGKPFKSSGGKMVESELGEVPEGWRIESLGDILELAYGKALKEDQRKEGAFPVYGSNGQVGMHNEKLVDGPGIVVGRKGNPGIVTWVQNDFFKNTLHFLF